MVHSKHHTDLTQYSSLMEARDNFEWDIPNKFNIASAVCECWAEAPNGKRRVALFYEGADGTEEVYTYQQLQRHTNRVANALSDFEVKQGTRIGIILPNRPEALFANIGALKCGATVVPISPLYGREGVEYRLDHSETEIVVASDESIDLITNLKSELSNLETIINVDGEDLGIESWSDTVGEASQEYDTLSTAAEDPAYIIYTSGTTGKPKGVHHSHRMIIGYSPLWQMIYEFPDETAVHYTPASWSWVGGLFANALTALYQGQPILGYDGQFDPTTCYELLEKYDVTHALLTPTMMRMIMEEDPSGYDLQMEVVPSGGEKVTPDIHEFVEEEWDAVANEIYGQTECNFLIGTNHELMEVQPEALGMPAPGHEVEIIDEETGGVLDDGEIGHIAVKSPDPSMFLEYLDETKKTEQAFVDDWMKTGDAGVRDENGYIHFKGRSDNIIITSGYRVSPLEIEECIRELSFVSDGVATDVPHETRGAVIKAFVQLSDDRSSSEEISDEIKSYVREQLAAYMYPRRIEYVEEFPRTPGGKIQRHKLTE